MSAHPLAAAFAGARSRAMLLAPVGAECARWPVGAHPVRDAFALDAGAIKVKGFRLPAAAESLSLCVAKEKVTKEKGHPAWRLPGILPGKSVRVGRAFRQGILPWRKGIDIHVDARCAACRPPLTAAQGPQVEQRAILARTFQNSQVKSVASVAFVFAAAGARSRAMLLSHSSLLSTHSSPP